MAKKAAHLFAGLAQCHCGKRMYVPSNTPKYVCYACRTKIPVVDLEGIFREQLKSFFFSSDEIATYLRRADERIRNKEELAQTLDREKSTNFREMDRLYRRALGRSSGCDHANAVASMSVVQKSVR